MKIDCREIQENVREKGKNIDEDKRCIRCLHSVEQALERLCEFWLGRECGEEGERREGGGG